MSERMIKAVVLSVALGWATQGVAQDVASGTSASVISLVGHPIKIQPATPLDKFLWAGVVLVNPGNEYAPVPLYGYQIKDLGDDIYEKALIEAAKGNVHIAVAKRDSLGEDVYSLQGVLVKSVVEEELKAGWSKFREYNIDDNGLIAFTRPLKLGDNNGVKKTEFITTPILWTKLATE